MFKNGHYFITFTEISCVTRYIKVCLLWLSFIFILYPHQDERRDFKISLRLRSYFTVYFEVMMVGFQPRGRKGFLDQLGGGLGLVLHLLRRITVSDQLSPSSDRNYVLQVVYQELYFGLLSCFCCIRDFDRFASCHFCDSFLSEIYCTILSVKDYFAC